MNTPQTPPNTPSHTPPQAPQNLSAAVLGVGVLGPGIADWAQLQAVLRGEQSWAQTPTALPAPALLPPAERRRASRVVKAALEAGTQAIAQAGLVASDLPVVFASSGGDGHNCHALCEQLAQGDRLISPTRFHNSVHNAASGYWSIATGAMAPAQVIAAFDASFALGLFETLSQVQYGRVPAVLLAVDSEYPSPLHEKRPIADVSALALVLGPVPDDFAGPVLTLSASQAWHSAAPSGLPPAAPAALAELCEQLPPWRGLSLLGALTQATASQVLLHVEPGQSLAVQVRP
jgi:hypothetical protein